MNNLSGRAPMKRSLMILVLAGMLAGLQGCAAYLHHRGNDLCDLADLGITVSEKPHFAFYTDAPFLELFPIGWANVDGRFSGLGGERPRHMSPHYEANRGLLLWGKEERTFEYRQADLEKMTPQERRKTLSTHHVGLIGVIQDLVSGNWPTLRDFVSCPHYIHFGYYGIIVTGYWWEGLDFAAGLLMLDPSGDDQR